MKIYLFFVGLIISFFGVSQNTLIPDANFEQRLINLGLDNIIDGSVLTANINSITSLDVKMSYISDLTGIEDFIALDTLYCQINQLTSLDMSQNTALTYLNCGGNELTSLDVSQNTALTLLYCYTNQLTALDVTHNTALYYLKCQVNKLLDLDVTQNSALEFLYCHVNKLPALNLSQNTSLSYLSCFSNQIMALDLSQNTALAYLSCGDNLLTCLNVKNGNNVSITDFEATQNANLTCIEVDDVAWSNVNWTVSGNNIDPASSFSTNCGNSCSVGLGELSNTPKQLVKVVDLMGRETKPEVNTPLIYIYSDGSTQIIFNTQP